MIENPTFIDPYLFECHYDVFKSYVENISSLQFNSFTSNPFTYEQEGYKSRIYSSAKEKLTFQAWIEEDIGSGHITKAVIDAIELPNNNLVPWQARFGLERRPHNLLHELIPKSELCIDVETDLFKLFHSSEDNVRFDNLVNLFGKKYSLIAYLYFIKDKSKYLPIAPSHFDEIFEMLGSGFKTSQKCTWENYLIYLSHISEIKRMLNEHAIGEASLLDAHSFCWMLGSHVKESGHLPDVNHYKNLPKTERDAIVKSRIGQGQFRSQLINYWGMCSVTKCSFIPILRASHIKPWSTSSNEERLDLYNGLLLSPNMDICFDQGLISFDKYGLIIVSQTLSSDDKQSLGISNNQKLIKISDRHQKFLKFHRENIFKNT